MAWHRDSGVGRGEWLGMLDSSEVLYLFKRSGDIGGNVGGVPASQVREKTARQVDRSLKTLRKQVASCAEERT
ncbi:hypothetical protein IQ235_15480 [Oscillatoriales cyanobacterium LEGE 11467]|uniref:Uncharacterized protein n=1 Tax=Zarconia navalis LEGE 11467 TaxID=1828826 RepID=A0A928VYX7_9CYAN|nr:hypothetical protein [Zarconia navalis]MBE9042179.1 hypothetical protein [Zarconia navalis LEGE 11467]